MSKNSHDQAVQVCYLGQQEYPVVYDAMLEFTQQRDQETQDQLWFLQHPPVFTQGQAGKAEHLLATGDIPVVPVDRGGQVTYHGPGQLVVYLLVDIKRKGWGPRELVSAIEQAIVDTLANIGIESQPRPDAPGVYVIRDGQPQEKIASLGLKIKKGCSFHGLSLNIDMDLEPFLRINPCGYAGMVMTQVVDQLEPAKKDELASDLFEKIDELLVQALIKHLGYTDHTEKKINEIEELLAL